MLGKNNKRGKEKMKKDYSNIWGAIVGDIAGSRFEWHPHKSKDFELLVEKESIIKDEDYPLVIKKERKCYFTDDTVMTLAIANALMECKKDFSDLKELTIENMQFYGNLFPHAGYGRGFKNWLFSLNPQPYRSYGNGSAMRVSAVAYFAKNIDEVKKLSAIVTDVTHGHPEGIKGAEATAVCTFMALNGSSKEDIIAEAKKYYNLDFDYQDLLKNYRFDETCQGTVPQSIFAFAISTSYEDAIRTAISMGGDADTMGAITGAIAGAYYGVPEDIKTKAEKFLPKYLLEVVKRFEKLQKKGE